MPTTVVVLENGGGDHHTQQPVLAKNEYVVSDYPSCETTQNGRGGD